MAANVRHSSETAEHYTPAYVVDVVRAALGTIDVDPASCEAANRVVQARHFFTRADDGLRQPWRGTVFLNPLGGWCDADGRLVIKGSKTAPACTVSGACGLPPGHTHVGVTSSQKRWWEELARRFDRGDVAAAVFLSFSVELLQTSQVDATSRTPHSFTICFPSRRIAYTREDGTKGASPPHSSMLVYLGPDVARFVSLTSELGRSMGPVQVKALPDLRAAQVQR
jgi:ParB family chromosome partitioning protein